MEDKYISEAEDIVILFRYIQKEFRDYMITHLSSHGFTFSQLILMNQLYKTPGINLNELSQKLSLSKSTTSGIIDRLEAQKLVIRERPSYNKRIVKIYLTENGLGSYNTIRMEKNNYLANMLSKASKKEVDDIIISLNKLAGLFSVKI